MIFFYLKKDHPAAGCCGILTLQPWTQVSTNSQQIDFFCIFLYFFVFFVVADITEFKPSPCVNRQSTFSIVGFFLKKKKREKSDEVFFIFFNCIFFMRLLTIGTGRENTVDPYADPPP